MEGHKSIEAGSQSIIEVVCIDKLLNFHETIMVPPHTILLDALIEVGFMTGPCGGIGKCGRCVVEIDDGILVQSCYYLVTKNITVRKWRGF